VSVTNQKDKNDQLPKIKRFADTVTQTWRTIPQDLQRRASWTPITPTTPTTRTTPSRALNERADDGACSTVSSSPARALAVRSPQVSPVRFETEPFRSDGQLISVVDQLTQTNAELTRHIVELSKDQAQAASKAHTEFANTMRVLAEGPMSHRERPKDR
jgi:hypothetical protein